MNSKERRAKIAEITTKIEATREAVRKGHESGDMTVRQDREATEKVEALNKELHAAICEGAKPCPNCGLSPIYNSGGTKIGDKSTVRGLRHEAQGKKGSGSVLYLYEVGCISAGCKDHRATDMLPELAVERWNEGDYDPPRAEESAPVSSEG